jgi:hypothetical protein
MILGKRRRSRTMRNSAQLVILLLLSILCFAQMSIAADVPCSEKNGPTGWHTFVDRTHRFCFQYPPIYRVGRDTSKRRSIVALEAEGEIYLWLDERPFKLQELEAFSRSGNPPEPTKLGGVTFYYVGPGGGGVFYPDDYLFNLRGKILHIEFDGPYFHDNHPSEEAKKLEPQLLATFRTF